MDCEDDELSEAQKQFYKVKQKAFDVSNIFFVIEFEWLVKSSDTRTVIFVC